MRPNALTIFSIGVLVSGCNVLCRPARRPEDAVFVPGTLPLDTDGNIVHAHDGGMFQQNGKFFWYGTTVKYAPDWLADGINLYSSTDLQSWTFEGEIFSDSDITDAPFDPPYRKERAKILYSAEANEYTMLFHLCKTNFEMSRVGIVKAGDIRGPWRWIGSFEPDGKSSYDMTAWQDTDGTGYLVRTVENNYLGVSELNENFTDTKGICSSTVQAEAPAVFKPSEEEYIIIGSHLTLWDPNPPQQFRSRGKTLCEGNLEVLTPPVVGPGSETTYNSQSTYVFPLRLETGQQLFIYMGDRWNVHGEGSLAAASYVWLPLIPRPDGDGYELIFLKRWSPKSIQQFIASRSRISLSQRLWSIFQRVKPYLL